jgi:hypothetical protein
MAKIKQLIVSLLFMKLGDTDFVSYCHTVATRLPNNPLFPSPPVDPTVFKTAVDSLATSVTVAKDGGKKAVAEKNKQRHTAATMMRTLAHYVEANCNNDLPTLLSSGFEPKPQTKAQAQPLEQPIINDVTHGKEAGQMIADLKRVEGARVYDIRSGEMPGGNTAPTTWSDQYFPNARKPAVINGLKPGTTYAFQVRAYGPLGWTPYSDPVIRMAT